jgi:hypothetical protein
MAMKHQSALALSIERSPLAGLRPPEEPKPSGVAGLALRRLLSMFQQDAA